jgi:hypothetical protein
MQLSEDGTAGQVCTLAGCFCMHKPEQSLQQKQQQL